MSTYKAKAPMHKNRNTTINRVSGYLNRDNLFRDVNLPKKLYGETVPFTSTEYWTLPGGSGAWKEYAFVDIIDRDFQPVSGGQNFGPTWTTHWFKVVVTVPQTMVGKEVHLRWGTGCESTLWAPGPSGQGVILQGMSPGYREEYIISKNWQGGGPITYYIEMACNDMFGAGDRDLIAPPNENRFFSINRAEIAVFNRDIYKAYMDLDVLHQISNHLPNEHIGYQALFAANEMVTLLKREQIEQASQLADEFFAEKNGEKQHTLISMGHCHIDTAWLWPYDETIRKCARSWSAQIGLMDEYPDYVFACSSAQQFAWVQQYYPQLFAQIKTRVASGQFVPVGGAWIEMDGNLPSGEGFVRQFFYGQRFYQQEFGLLTKEFWLPDTFGYAAQIPQIMKHVGITRFITQKMSWSIVNKFPNHNFWWEGIDGTEVLVHFPPGNSYNMNGNIDEILFSRNNSEDKGRANVGVYLYGYGDGGGGPTRQMIEKQIRVRDVDGIPKVQFGSPELFWTTLERESSKLYKWVGELYLELHNGTYTSQAKIKWYNRKCDIFFREVELLFSIAYVTGKVTQTKLTADMATLDINWKNYLLNQFHDVLPGSCIEMAAVDAWKIYEDIFTALTNLRTEYHGLILPTGTGRFVYNALNWAYKTVIFQRPDTGVPPIGPNIQSVTLRPEVIEESTEGRYRVPSTFSASLVQFNASGYSAFDPIAPTNPVTYTSAGGVGEFTNGHVRLTFPLTGRPVESLFFTGPSQREKTVFNDRLNTGTDAAMMYIYDDVPMYWDAWDVMDYHLETRDLPSFTAQTNATTFAEGPIVGGYKWTGTFGNGSTFERYSFMRADSPMVEYYLIIDWKEDHKFLKVEWPVDVLSRDATFEIQYGHAKRPTHINTSWDMAKFEVCGHKWMDISQADKGVTFITDSKYGWHVRDNIVKLSMLKSPKNPDANCDIHVHYIHYAVMPHEGPFQEAEVIQRAYELNFYGANNVPLLVNRALTPAPPSNFVTVSNPAVIVEAFKPAHDVAGSVVVRLYEAYGGNAEATTITLGFPVATVNECDGLERVGAPVQHNNNAFSTNFTPFQLKTFIIAFQ